MLAEAASEISGGSARRKVAKPSDVRAAMKAHQSQRKVMPAPPATLTEPFAQFYGLDEGLKADTGIDFGIRVPKDPLGCRRR